MKKLSLKLYTNNELTINRELNFYIKDNIINFNDNDILYKYDLNNDIFIKKDKEYENKFLFKENMLLISMLNTNYSFDYKLENVTINKGNNIIKIEYDTEEHHLIIINY